MRSPVCWFGGKMRMARRIVALLPEHKTYVEPFGGGAAVLFAKPPSLLEVYNDLDSGLVGFFRVLRNRRQFKRLQFLASLTPFSREEYNTFRKTWEKTRTEVRRAYEWFVVARMSFAARFGGSWATIVTTSTNGMASHVHSWLSAIEHLPRAYERLIRVEVEHQDFRVILERYDTAETLFYLDPPYVPETRRSGEYRHELTREDHEDLVERLLRLKGKALLSGYPNTVYRPLERSGWKRKRYKVISSAAGATRATGLLGKGSRTATQQRTECLWISPSARK